ncbi:hypothetical protein BH11PLA1_BH11PLA1_18090 [soil metagenome]
MDKAVFRRSLLLACVGFALQVGGYLASRPYQVGTFERPGATWMLWGCVNFVGLLIFMDGLAGIAASKGRTRWWFLAGFASILGLAVVLSLPEAERPETLGPRT